MAVILTAGSAAAIASTYGSSVNMTAITNATNAVATLAAGHGVVVGDFLEVTSGWGRLNGRIARVSAVATNDVTLEGIATTNTALFPTGLGAGSIRRITAWQAMTQVRGISVSGGEAQMIDVTDIADVVERQIPGMKSAIEIELDVIDDPAMAWYATVQAAELAGAPAALRLVFPNGSRLVANAYWSMQAVPGVEKNAALGLKVKAAVVAQPTRYAS